MSAQLAPWDEVEQAPAYESRETIVFELPHAHAERERQGIFKALPHSADAEAALLGSFLIDPSSVGELCLDKGVNASFFHLPSNATVFRTLWEMWNEGDPLDLVTVTEVFFSSGKLDQIGGPSYLNKLFTEVPTAANAVQYIEILRDKLLRRQVIEACNAQMSAAYQHGTPEETAALIEGFRSSVANIGSTDASKDWDAISEIEFNSLLNFDRKNDPNCLLGDRWLCKGGAVLWVAQAGMGKSSMLMQASMMWSVGADFFGISPGSGLQLKSLIIQAENDEGDLSEMAQGVITTMRNDEPEEIVQQFIETFQKRLVFVRSTAHTGKDFGRLLRKLIRKHQPHLVWIDPLLSYVGDDISKQAVASDFLRNTLNPIALETGVGLMIMHHTGKPSADAKSKDHWNEDDLSYHAFGSSELVNWARATVILHGIGEGHYALCFAKRRNRAGAKDLDGNPTDTIFLRHADVGIYWDQVRKPEGLEDEQKKPKPNYREAILAEMSIIDGQKASSLQRKMSEETGITKSRFYAIWESLKAARKITNRDGLWFKAGRD